MLLLLLTKKSPAVGGNAGLDPFFCNSQGRSCCKVTAILRKKIPFVKEKNKKILINMTEEKLLRISPIYKTIYQFDDFVGFCR